MGVIKYFIPALLLLLVSCQAEPEKGDRIPPPNKEDLIKKHQSRIQTEEDRIEAYIQRRSWEMQETGSGLRYLILNEGKGANAQKGMTATVNYKISLLNGRLCYASEEGDPESFVVGQDAVESGLHEGITFMNKGSKAVLIMPPHLAHGLIGDREKIPANASLVFEIELIDLQ